MILRGYQIFSTHIKHGEILEDAGEFFIERVLSELHFAHVEVPDAADFKVFVDDLCKAEPDIVSDGRTPLSCDSTGT